MTEGFWEAFLLLGVVSKTEVGMPFLLGKAFLTAPRGTTLPAGISLQE